MWQKNGNLNQGDHFVPCSINREIDARPHHSCCIKKSTILTCIDETGIEHEISFVHCACESLALTLVRAQLWPATPQQPKLAFTFRLLDWAEALLLECQVALKDFCSALHFYCPYIISKRRDVYKSLIDCFEEYRYIKHERRYLSYISGALDSGNVCPACPKISGGKLVYAIDALFGLPRKKATGVSHRAPLHGHLFFLDQSAIDEHVSTIKMPQKHRDEKSQCSDFLAGNAMRSSKRYKALDETALFGVACRHEFPAAFVNLKHGESNKYVRLSYGEWVLEQLIEKKNINSKCCDVYVMYDIACTLYKHLKTTDKSELLTKVKLCLPSFHSYGHSVSCQVSFGPLRCDGIGLSDGETKERLWSYLRRYGRMTKEMRPSHRIDVLVHALVHHGMKTSEKLARLLMQRLERAQNVLIVAEEAYAELVADFEENIDDGIVKKWLEEEQSVYADTSKHKFQGIPQWKVTYFIAVQSYHILQDQLSSGDTPPSLSKELSRVISILEDCEIKHNLKCRWTPSDREYMQIREAFNVEHQRETEQSMLRASMRRQFLLRLKAKYAGKDGQKIAKRLSTQILKETKKIKALLLDYKMCPSEVEISMEEALDPSLLACKLDHKLKSSSMAVKQDIIQASLLIQRSKEEIDMLQCEMQNTLAFYQQKKKIDAEIIKLTQAEVTTDFTRGSVALLHHLKLKVMKAIDNCNSRFATINEDSKVAESLLNEDSSSTEPDSDYYDSEDD